MERGNHSIRGHLVLTFLAILCAATNAGADAFRFLRNQELICSGSVTWGQYKWRDELFVRVFGDYVRIGGKAGETTTFESVTDYAICSEGENEIELAYNVVKCGDQTTRAGLLNKVTGTLRLWRSDRENPFVGEYVCKPMQRVLE